jgi:hypothetical protein
MKNLTLSVNEKVIAQAKRLAARQRTSVSTMFAQFVASASRRNNAPPEIPPDSVAARVTGAIRLPRGKSERGILTAALMQKCRVK